jgi:hypothetical protein
MILADTSVWIEFLRRNTGIFPIMRELLDSGDILATEFIFGELLQGTRSKKETKVILDFWKYLPKANEQGIWLDAGEYSAKNSLPAKGIGLIDSAIVCFARKYGAKIWSLDRKLNRFLTRDEIYLPST